eukprot:502238-Rhodomonas_salina.2
MVVKTLLPKPVQIAQYCRRTSAVGVRQTWDSSVLMVVGFRIVSHHGMVTGLTHFGTARRHCTRGSVPDSA